LSDLSFAFHKKARRILVNSALFFGHDARIILLLAPARPSGRPCGIGYLAPLGSHHASIFQGFTLAIVSFETPHGIIPLPSRLMTWAQ